VDSSLQPEISKCTVYERGDGQVFIIRYYPNDYLRAIEAVDEYVRLGLLELGEGGWLIDHILNHV
jgi:hypothetical protein